MSAAIDLPARPRILVIVLRRLGDVLLATPLLRTLRRGYPDATIDVLVFRGSHRILAGNPDIDGVLTVAERPGFVGTLRLAASLRRRYHLVVSTQAGDRPAFAALLGGGRRAGLVTATGSGTAWKRRIYRPAVVSDPDVHRVEDLLRIADALGLARYPDAVCPQGGSADEVAPDGRYAVLHPNPMYRYKRWSDEGWRALARGLVARGLAVVVSEGRDPQERAYIDSLWNDSLPLTRERGRLDWPGLAALLRGAAVYVGPDTSMTHLAAATGCPTVALYGPTSPRLTGPWPLGGLERPWEHAGAVQQRGNVIVVQNPLPCMPCERLGCERHLDSRSACLEELEAETVLALVDRMLQAPSAASAEARWRVGANAVMQSAMTSPTGRS